MTQRTAANVLVIAAHPDDETLGVGATVDKHTQMGDAVTFLFVTDGFIPEPNDGPLKQVKRECSMDAARVLGVENVEFLGLPGLLLDTVSQARIGRLLTDVVDKVRPNIVYTHFPGDLNHDHQIVSRASLVACRPHRDRIVKKILFYEVLSSTEWGVGSGETPFQPLMFHVLTEENVRNKQQAFRCYHTEVFPSPHPRSVETVESLARLRGAHINVQYAEAFMLVRDIID